MTEHRMTSSFRFKWRGMSSCLVFCYVAVSAVVIGCDQSAEGRIKQYFDVHAKGEATTTQIREAILNKVPLGATPQQVYDFLDKAGIGSNLHSRYYKLDDPDPDNLRPPNTVLVRIDYVNRPWRLVYVSYGIGFTFDQNKKLLDVKVGRGLTGL